MFLNSKNSLFHTFSHNLQYFFAYFCLVFKNFGDENFCHVVFLPKNATITNESFYQRFLRFLRNGGREVIITAPEYIKEAVLSGMGTHIVP